MENKKWNVTNIQYENEPRVSYLCSCIIDDLFCGQITFVAHQQLVDGFARISIDFLKPLFDIVERLLICHIVDNDDTVCSAVVTVKETKKKLSNHCEQQCA